ncbi:DUF421 domain-containing protein [Metabacillus idriensis]|uniref:DUF421 domain-containing protein n=1 Tax=Metabacillus idriensis TaxID=324768 RepID=UPI003D2DBEA9
MIQIELVKDIGIVVFRIATILPLLLLFTLFMGKRSIGELPVFDFLAILTLGAVVGADIADPHIAHLPTVAAIVFIAVLQKSIAKWKVSNRKIEQLITFEPTVIIENGLLLSEPMKSIQYTIDNILGLLREQGIFNLTEVELAVIEGNGKLSVLKNMNSLSALPEPAFPLIAEGNVFDEVLEFFGVNRQWLLDELKKQHIQSFEDVFFASITKKKEIHICTKQISSIENPPLQI